MAADAIKIGSHEDAADGAVTGIHIGTAEDPEVREALDSLDLTTVLAGEVDRQTKYSQQMEREIADVMVPVMGPEGRVLGIVRLSHQYSNVYDDLLRLRYVIGGVLFFIGYSLGFRVGYSVGLNILKRYLDIVNEDR